MPKKKTSAQERTFKVRYCPKCSSDQVGILLGKEGRTKDWECKKCSWKGKDVVEKELNEDEFMQYLDERGEEVA